MRRSLLLLSVLSLLLVLAACASEPAATPPAESAEPTAAATPDTSADPLSGTWTGDWGPTPTHRNAVSLELNWDGSNLTGTVNPGADAVPLTKATYDSATGNVMMEADAQGRGGTVHYMIEGKVDGKEMMGSWSHGDSKGDFKIMKQ